MARVTIRLDFGPDQRVGPGKIRLLEAIAETGSIAAGGRLLGMSYRRAWLLVDALNHMFQNPVLVAKLGGAAGGSSVLTPFGEELVSRYRAIEAGSQTTAQRDLDRFEALLTPPEQPRAG
jgi:molybdate transport system regulatory protein